MREPAALLAASLALYCAGLAGASPYFYATEAWVRVTPGADVAAAYFTLRNTGTTPVVIVGVRSPSARSAMIHESRLENGHATMRPQQRLTIAPASTLHLAPGGLHVMLAGLVRPLRPGDSVPLVLLLEGGGTLGLTPRVRALTAD